MQPLRSDSNGFATNPLLFTARWLTVALLAAAFVYYVIASWHWRLMVDSPIMHYVVYLMRHGLRPYTDISDNNMPGAYLTEATAMRLFGPTDLAWRLYEFSLLLTLTAAFAFLSRRWDWVAGVFAGGMFIVIHGLEGPRYAGERELVLTVLLAVSLVCLFTAVEHRRPWPLLLFGFLAGLAASIKPTFIPLPLLLLLFAAVVLRRRGIAPWSYIACALGGMALMAAVDLGFLLHFHALGGFLFILREVLPAYAGLSNITLRQLLIATMTRATAVLIVLGLPLAWANRRLPGAWNWERFAFVLCAAFSLFSFFAQRKGFIHHRYAFISFVLLLLGIEFFIALRRPGWPRALAIVAVLFAFAFHAWKAPQDAPTIVGHSDLELAVESDFNHLGGAPALQGKIMCFDMVFGCLDALYHLDIQENIGFTGDLLLFTPLKTAPVRYYRGRYWQLTAANPPTVLMLSNQVLSRPNSFAKVDTWPAFAQYLHDNYTPVVERHFTFEHFGGRFATPVPPDEQDAYRLYIRNGSPLLAKAATLPDHLAVGQTAPAAAP